MFILKQRLVPAFAPASVLLLLLSSVPAATAQTQGTPDNAGTNKSQNQSATADQQKNNVSDRELAAKIRRSVVSDKSLSMYSHNVKIVVAGGSATLKGPVHSEAEKQAIGQKAADIVGADKVSNELTIKQ
ncbi:transport-associated protein [Acidisarcina polymorpha]|uniref:Transport-associated protein n=1 Tax=Acidisarcina polymorpha TaxID=2211140 RepID=A0A2Z5FTU6_9BACT|nr:BON domain-containing protein [Acidisarcina polymorpha]AXC10243.1 transport-associated protein [Acidisarcina polymorpha]